MPVLRAYGGLSPTWGGYVNAQHHVSKKNDTSILEPGIDSVIEYHGYAFRDGYYVVGYWPWANILVGLTALATIGGGMLFLAMAAGEFPWSLLLIILASLMTPAMFLFWLYPPYHVYGKFVVFDRINGLVHIPRLLSGHDRIRFEDASFIFINRIHYGGMRSSVYWYLYRPGMDLVRDSIPYGAWRWLLELYFNYTEKAAQEDWHFLVHFMKYERNAINSIEEVYIRRFNLKLPFYRQYHRFKYVQKQLGTAPNWERAADGTWKRLEDHPWARFYKPMKLINIPVTIGIIYGGWYLLKTLFAEPIIWSNVWLWSAVFLACLFISFMYHVIAHDARGSTGVPLYTKEGLPVGSLGFYYGLKKKLGLQV